MRAIFPSTDFLPFLGHVYEPAGDSFLLVDAILDDLEFIKDLQVETCLEIGSGSGIVITTAALALQDEEQPITFHATDINIHAINATKKCLELNKMSGKVMLHHSNLADGFKNNCSKKVDLLLSNPPFEPCDKVENDKSKVDCAWTAVKDGREIINKIIKELPNLMSEKGVFYMAMIADNNLADVAEEMAGVGFPNYKIIEEKDETTSSNFHRTYHQYVVRFSR